MKFEIDTTNLNKDKQIAEMAEIILDVDRSYYGMACDEILAKAEATAIYDKGYRKASDVALEVIGEVEKIIDKYYNRHIFGVEDLSDVEKEAVMNFSDDITGDLAELKEKYTESEDTE